jgi:hypothetical protein
VENNDVSILVLSCDKYEVCWDPFFKLKEKYWKCDYPVYIATETKDCVRAKALKFTGSWTSRIRRSLEQIPTKYVIIMCEDFFIRRPVDQKRIDYCVDHFDQDTATFSFETPYAQTLPSDKTGFKLKPNRSPYLMSCQPSIWNRRILIEFLSKDMTPWEWEMQRISSPYKFYINSDKLIIDVGYNDEQGRHRLYGVVKGEWYLRDVEPLFKKEGINVDLTTMAKTKPIPRSQITTSRIRLSIIIPTYNVEKYINECLASIIPQITDEVELIIIDDCSTDQTVDRIMEYYEKTHFNVTLTKLKKNGGVSHTRNVGLERATGEYVAFIDGDDYVANDYVKTILNVIRTGDDYYTMSWRSFEQEQKVYKSHRLPNPAVWARVFKRSIIKYPFDEEFVRGEDIRFLEQNIIGKSLIGGTIPNVLYHYRFGRSGSLTHSRVPFKRGQRKEEDHVQK